MKKLLPILSLSLLLVLSFFAVSGSGGWTPSVRVSIYKRKLRQSQIAHNVPPEVCWHPLHAAAYFVDCPNASIYVPTMEHGGVHYLHDLLVEMDLIDAPGAKAHPASE